MSKKKDPPGYPGDEAVMKAFGEGLQKLRIEKGLSMEQVDAVLDEAAQQDSHPFLPRALGLVIRQLREERNISRAQLSDVAGVSLRLLNRLERGKVREVPLTQIVRLAFAMNYPITDLVERVTKLNQQLQSSADRKP